MSEHTGELMSVKIIPNEKGNPPGKLADAEVIFEADAGPLSGLKLIGFSVWERRDGGRNVTFPARQYSVNGERRSFALLRPANGEASAQDAIRQCILDAYTRVETTVCPSIRAPQAVGPSARRLGPRSSHTRHRRLPEWDSARHDRIGK